MERGFRKQEDPNCQCQCHFPSHIICQITSCCHCMCNYNNTNNYSPNYNDRFYLSNSNSNYCKDGINPELMNSCSTNFRSGNESFNNSQNSLINNLSNKKNYYTMRKIQNQDLIQNKLQRNFSDPHFNINNDSHINNNNYTDIIQQDPYKNTNESFYKNNYNNNFNNNSIIMNEPINPLNQSNNNNNLNNNKNNLTYVYKDNLNKDFDNDLTNNNIPNTNNIQNSNNSLNNITQDSNPIDLTYLAHNNNIDQLKSDLVKAHDIISILKKENDFLKNQRDGAMNQLSAYENMKNIDRVKCDEIKNENIELRKRLNDEIKQNKIKDNYISDLKEQINDLDNIIHDKDREIQDLITNMRRMEQDANNEIAKLKNKIDDLNREKEKIIRDFQKEIKDLNDELRHLNNLLEDEKRKVKELENKIKTMKRFDGKKQELLDTLFNWYNTINKLLNTNTATGKAPPKDLLNDVINLQTIDEFKDKLNQIEEKLQQFINDMKLKFGECFACDIACCTSEVDRLKYFRKYYPGPPRDYLEGRKKCKCV